MKSEEFFEIIRDGTWHDLNELANQIEVPIEKLITFSLFLFNEGIVDCQEKTSEIRIKSEWKIIFEDEDFNDNFPKLNSRNKISPNRHKNM